jgi:hypothetical protein
VTKGLCSSTCTPYHSPACLVAAAGQSVCSQHNGDNPAIETAYLLKFAEYQPHAVGDYVHVVHSVGTIPGWLPAPRSWDESYITICDDYCPWLQLLEAVRESPEIGVVQSVVEPSGGHIDAIVRLQSLDTLMQHTLTLRLITHRRRLRL